MLVCFELLAPKGQRRKLMMLAWSAAVPQAVVLPALVLGSPGLVLPLVSVETVVELVPVEAALSESLGPDHRSGPNESGRRTRWWWLRRLRFWQWFLWWFGCCSR